MCKLGQTLYRTVGQMCFMIILSIKLQSIIIIMFRTSHLGVGGHKFKSLGKLPNGCTDWHRMWYTSADSSGNGHRLNTIHPSIPQGVLGGHKFKSLGKLSNNCPIGTKFGARLRIRLGMDIG